MSDDASGAPTGDERRRRLLQAAYGRDSSAEERRRALDDEASPQRLVLVAEAATAPVLRRHEADADAAARVGLRLVLQRRHEVPGGREAFALPVELDLVAVGVAAQVGRADAEVAVDPADSQASLLERCDAALERLGDDWTVVDDGLSSVVVGTALG